MKKLQLMTVLMMLGIVALTDAIFAEGGKSKGGKSDSGRSQSKGSNSQEASSNYDKMSLKELEAARDAHNKKVKNAPKSEHKELYQEAVAIKNALNKKQKSEKISNAQSAQSAKIASSPKVTTAQANKPAPTGQNMPNQGANVGMANQGKYVGTADQGTNIMTAQTDKENHTQGQNMPNEGEYAGSADQGANL